MQEELKANQPYANAAPVLVVEDNRLNQKVAVLLLERLGMTVQVAQNGREAIKAVSERRFSIILMDCHMPEMDGFEATVAIRTFQASTGIYTPIIAVTALTADGDRQKCLEAGMDDYLAKPIEKELLKAKINQWLVTAASVETPGAMAKLKSAIATNQNRITQADALNFKDLEDFYGKKILSDMLQIFMKETNEKLSLMELSISEKNVDALTVLAKQLKASCASIGAKQLATLCNYQQSAAAKLDWIEAVETLNAMHRLFGQVKHLLQCGIITEENEPIKDSDFI